MNKEETFIFGSSELKPERTQGAIFIEKLGQFTVKSEVKPKVIAEEIQSFLQERNDPAEIVLPVEKQKDFYEFMILKMILKICWRVSWINPIIHFYL